MNEISANQETPVTFALEFLRVGDQVLEHRPATASSSTSSEPSLFCSDGDGGTLVVEPKKVRGNPTRSGTRTQLSGYAEGLARPTKQPVPTCLTRRPRAGTSRQMRPRSQPRRRSTCRRLTRGASSGGDPPGGGSDPDPSDLEQRQGSRRRRPDQDAPEVVA